MRIGGISTACYYQLIITSTVHAYCHTTHAVATENREARTNPSPANAALRRATRQGRHTIGDWGVVLGQSVYILHWLVSEAMGLLQNSSVNKFRI